MVMVMTPNTRPHMIGVRSEKASSLTIRMLSRTSSACGPVFEVHDGGGHRTTLTRPGSTGGLLPPKQTLIG